MLRASLSNLLGYNFILFIFSALDQSLENRGLTPYLFGESIRKRVNWIWTISLAKMVNSNKLMTASF